MKYSSPKNRSSPSRPHASPSKSASRLSRPTVRTKSYSAPTTTMPNTMAEADHTLDKLAVVAAILSLLAAILGLYIAWKTLYHPGQTAIVV
ncbi:MULTISPECIES: hypothetical protein [Paenibacillus]|uniref:hypothetical protein n=1 Tax=Paenibacillus TaxID=44249 RepID=UPI001F20132E|nr:hypothetical protein [Paenibacillus sp. JJ-223]CAH1208781.1 hypothetical protein PAECIP111890_03176 [Paenibacillus sp. JJ-223]